MSLIRISSPHAQKPGKAGDLMRQVILATLPGLATLVWFFGWGPLINVVWGILLALGFETAVMKLRKRPVGFYLGDYSAVLTALLLGLALPPFAPWWVTVVGIFVAIVVAKHLYGGLGQNPFNPAMIGYALLLISFPVQMTQWAAPLALTGDSLGFIETFKVIFELAPTPDAYTMATPLDTFKHKGALTAEELWAQSELLQSGLSAWQAVGLAYLVGGVYLMIRKVYTWHIPVSMLFAIFMISGFFYGSDPSNYAPPLFHLCMGATLLGAFFIATDPVTAATSNKGKLIFGFSIGILVYIIRSWGNYPDAVAFAVLLMNLAAPFLDYYTRPRAYGHKKANRGVKG